MLWSYFFYLISVNYFLFTLIVFIYIMSNFYLYFIFLINFVGFIFICVFNLVPVKTFYLPILNQYLADYNFLQGKTIILGGNVYYITDPLEQFDLIYWSSLFSLTNMFYFILLIMSLIIFLVQTHFLVGASKLLKRFIFSVFCFY